LQVEFSFLFCIVFYGFDELIFFARIAPEPVFR
jgi:hypothetical protein